MSEQIIHGDIDAGLRQLADSAFAKRCKFYANEYRNSAEFLATNRTN